MSPQVSLANAQGIRPVVSATGAAPAASDKGRRYAVALLVWAVATVLTVWLMTRIPGTHPVAAFLMAIVASGWYAGTGPTVLVLVLSVLADRGLPFLLGRPDPLVLGVRDVWFASFYVGAAYFGVVRRRMVADLRAARENLEEQVALRTAELRRKESYLEQAQQLSQTACWAVPQAPGAGEFWWSAEAFRIFGLDPASSRPSWDTFYSLVHPDDLARARDIRDAAIRARSGFDVEHRVVRPSGEVRRIRSVGRPCFDHDGSVVEYLGVVMDVTDRSRAERALRRLRERTLRSRFNARLEERTRIARDMHDTLLQGVTGVALKLLAVTNRIHAPPEEIGELREVVDLARRTLEDARHAIWDIRAPMAGTLPDAVRAASEEAARSSGMRLDFEMTGAPRELDAEVQDALLRVVREAVLNAVTHSGGQLVRVELAYGRRVVRLCVVDDGQGFIVDRELRGYGGHWGLLGMRERAAYAGGRLRIRSAPGRGTRLVLVLPFASVTRAGSLPFHSPRSMPSTPGEAARSAS